MNFKNIIFDLDGVLVDSEPFHGAAKREVAKRYGLTLDDRTLLRFNGQTDDAFFEFLRGEHPEIRETVRELMRMKSDSYLSQAAEIQPIRGVADFVRKANAVGLRMCLVTSSPREYVRVIFEALPFNNLFQFVVCADDVQHHKPHPEPYLKAVSLLGAPVSESLVIEDSSNGVRSAKAAGLFTVGILTTSEPDILAAAGADLIVKDYSELQLKLNFI